MIKKHIVIFLACIVASVGLANARGGQASLLDCPSFELVKQEGLSKAYRQTFSEGMQGYHFVYQKSFYQTPTQWAFFTYVANAQSDEEALMKGNERLQAEPSDMVPTVMYQDGEKEDTLICWYSDELNIKNMEEVLAAVPANHVEFLSESFQTSVFKMNQPKK